MSASQTSQNSAQTLWTPANIVTLIRILLVPIFFVAFVSPWPTWFPDWTEAELVKPWLAALLFVVLSCTDALDGYLARSRGEVTNFGKFMDPLADKILVAAALLALCELQILPSWVALVILVREFIVSGLRMVAASQGVVIAASWYGKAKTVFQIIAIVMFIIKGSDVFTGDPTVALGFYIASWVLMGIALALTVISMLDYLVKSRGVLGFAMPEEQEIGFITNENDSPRDVAEHLSEGLAAEVIKSATAKNLKLSTAESCTGGLIAGALTAIPGSSEVIEGGIVSYSNEVKHSLLQVSSSDLETYGAVSQQVAQQMACGSRKALGTSIAIAVTGIAGPGGGSAEKPVGTVWFGVDSPLGTQATVRHFNGDRDEVRLQTVETALRLFKNEIDKL